MAREVNITDGGSLNFYEDQEGDISQQSKVSIAARDSMASSYSLLLPASRTDAAYLKHTADGSLVWIETENGFNWENIITYGATRGAASSDEIKLAIDAAVAANKDCVVFIPEGEFWLDTAITAPFATGVTIKFVGTNPEKSILRLTNSSTTGKGIDASANLLKRIEFHNIQFNCFAMGAAETTFERGGAIIDVQAEEVVVESCIFRGVGGQAALTIQNASTFARVHNCLFRDIYTTAVAPAGDQSSHCIALTTTGTIGSRAMRPTISITNNQFLCKDATADSGVGATVVTANFGDNPRDIVFADNYLYQCGASETGAAESAALDLADASDVVIRNNTFDYSSGPAALLGNSTRPQITGNRFLGESVGWTTDSRSIFKVSQTTDNCESLVFRNNIFERIDSASLKLSATYALEVVGDADTYIQDVTITGNHIDKTRRGVSLIHAHGEIRIEGNNFIELWGADADAALDDPPATAVPEDACIYLETLQGGDAANDETNVNVSNNGAEDCFGRFLYFSAASTPTNKRSFWLLNNRWETKTGASVFKGSGVLTLIGGASSRLSSVRLSGNNWRGLPAAVAAFSFVNITGVDGRFDAESVFEFGAVGDGTTDDTAALKQAFTLLGGDAINIPAGHIFNCSTMTGGDDTTTTLDITESGTLVTGGGTIKSGADYIGGIIGVTGTPDTIENITIENIELRPGTSDKGVGIIFDTAVDYLTVKGCKIGLTSGAFLDGVREGGAHTGDFLVVTGCDIWADSYGLSMGAGQQQTASHNHIRAGDCIKVNGTAGAESEHIILKGNILQALSGNKNGIVVDKVRGVVISGNTIEAETPIWFDGGSTGGDKNSNVSITGNVCFGVIEKGITVKGDSTNNFFAVVVSGNTIRGVAATTDYGIWLEDCMAPVVSGNSIVNCNSIAEGAHVYIESCIGAVVTGNSISMTGTLPGAGKRGVVLKEVDAGDTNGCLVTGNNIIIGDGSAGGVGVDIEDAQHSVVSSNSFYQTEFAVSGGTPMATDEPTSLVVARMVLNAGATGVNNTLSASGVPPIRWAKATVGGENATTGGAAASVYYIPLYLDT